MPQEYERDEFDEMAAQSGPVGVHRAPRPWWTRILPPLLAFLIAGGIAYAIALILWETSGGSTPEPTTTITTTPEPSDTPSATSSATPTTSAEPTESATASPTPTETEEPEPVIVYNAQVHVRNGAGIAGLAGGQQEELEVAGYTNIEANNISADLIPNGENTVTYSEERLADTAEDIASVLGIDAVSGEGTPGGAEIEVLLASDPDA